MNEQILAVQKMQDYIAEHLSEPITLADLSSVSQFSPWYSYRLFRRYTAQTPADYIRRLRLSRSALKLRDESCRIIDAAFELGFGSVDGYQRAFFREFGCNPREYADSPVPLQLFTPYGVKYKELTNLPVQAEHTRNIFIQAIRKPARKVIVRRGICADNYYDYCKEVGCDVWGLLMSIKSISDEPIGLWLPDRYRKPGTSEYVQGVEVEPEYKGVIPDGMDVIDLPAAQSLMFRGEPFQEERFNQAIREVWAAIDRYDPTIVGLSWDKSNPRIQLEPVGARGYIELCPVA
jgi:AraC family transcriptional regulator